MFSSYGKIDINYIPAPGAEDIKEDCRKQLEDEKE